jgi:type II secretory pathway predicted ATPase ExeA
MYNLQSNLLDAPFTSHNDFNFYFVSKNYKNLVSNILQAITNQQKFVLITGEPGVGKTRFIDYLINHLPPSVLPMVRKASEAESLHLMSEVSKGLDLPASGDHVFELHELEEILRELHNQHKHPVLIIDDAHLLSMHNLSEITLLHLMKINGKKLISMILVGNDEHLAEFNIFESNSFIQQIDIKLNLQPLGQSEIIEYIDHRLRLFSSSFNSCFEPGSSELIYHRTGGVPRSINQLCDDVLRSGMTRGLKKINRMNFAGIFELKPTECQFAQNNCGASKTTVSLGIGLALLLGAGIIFHGVGRDRLQSLISSHKLIASPLQDPGPAETKGTPNSLRDKPLQVVAQKTPSDKPSGAGEGVILSDQVSSTPDMEGKGELPISRPEESVPHTKWVVRSNESLTKIVTGHYRDYKQIGLEAVILANPDISNGDFITPGQILSLPKINRTTGEIELPDKSLYALYGIYTSAASLTNDLAWLAQRDIRYEVRETRGPNGVTLNHVFLGGYQKSQELQEARKRVRARVRGSRAQLPPLQ